MIGHYLLTLSMEQEDRVLTRQIIPLSTQCLMGAVADWKPQGIATVTIIQACHVKTRGSGGKDRNNLFPACASAHAEQHITGIRSFERRWGVDLKTIARQLTEVYEAEVYPCP